MVEIPEHFAEMFARRLGDTVFRPHGRRQCLLLLSPTNCSALEEVLSSREGPQVLLGRKVASSKAARDLKASPRRVPDQRPLRFLGTLAALGFLGMTSCARVIEKKEGERLEDLSQPAAEPRHHVLPIERIRLGHHCFAAVRSIHAGQAMCWVHDPH